MPDLTDETDDDEATAGGPVPAAYEAPPSYGQLHDAIAARQDTLSARLRQIAVFALAEPNTIAQDTVKTIALQIGVPPSAVIRFAKAFGFEGFSDMQRVFQTRLLDQGPSYRARLRIMEAHAPSDGHTILGHFVEAGKSALDHLREDIASGPFERTIELMNDAEIVHVMAQRRAFPVAAHLAYSLAHLGRRARLIDGLGGMTFQQAMTMTTGDVLLAVSFAPYAPDTLDIVRMAGQGGVPVIAITDTPSSPLTPLATVALEVRDVNVQSFRSLTAPMCLATSLVVALGRRGERSRSRRRR
ncbi:MurR/RpiR family transcriptional regulator [Marinivivus vitaminiproducens]|uniref:MurR/RpiR family transcriptional regulator n=1 Tax=Marinivivus vitaminiproducens TaxID=3035935 RepID=UPI0027A083D9|nr:MurR/RpiR family transcriptional regulator [Geminicoccaceae bacterium SCSIO 64248]